MEARKLNYCILKIIFAVNIFAVIFSANARSQEPDFVPDRAEAIIAFNSKDYVSALKHYRALSEAFSADPVYKYYTGACMVYLERDPDESKQILKEAIANSSSIRTVPSQAWYYLGRAYQQAGDFELAIEAYDTFRESARKKEVRDLGIDELIAQCSNSIGDINVEDLSQEGEDAVKRAEGLQGDIVEPVDTIDIEEDTTGIIISDQDLSQEPTDEYNLLAREALENQFRADSLFRLANRYRETLSQLSETDRESVRSKILSLEQQGFEYQRIADGKYREAAGIASAEYDGRPVPPAISVDDQEDEANEIPGDTVSAQADTVSAIAEAETEDKRPYVPVVQIFSDDYDQAGNIPVNPELPEGLIYRIQLAAFRNPKDIDFFKGLGPISIYREQGSDINFYYAGIFRSKEDAGRALVKVKRKGFNDAFILALMNGARVSMDKAEQYETEWSDQSLFENDTALISKSDEPKEPPTLVYRIQVYRVDKKLKDDEIELLERLAGNRQYDIYETAGEEYVYLIGKFLTFESAAAYADLLYRNGMKEAEVVAYLGDKEIPLETAKKLFEIYFDK